MAVVLSRRNFVLGSGLLLSGCVATEGQAPSGMLPLGGYDYAQIYGPIEDNGFTVPGLDLASMNPDLFRRVVPFKAPYRPGTIVVNIPERRLYLVQPGGQAIRYAVGVGRAEALNFQGSAIIGRKAVWPHWAPTANMIHAMPKYAAYAGGMAGGLDNPLGARALYLYRGALDSDFRLHGTNEPDSIGQPVSSGCIRLLNHDIIDLYNRAPVGTPVIVVQAGWRPGAYAEDDQAAPPPVRVAGPVSEDGYWPPYGEGAYGYPPYSYKDVY
jgi:lipoprotein-anchoring transpeptidase ErfK/SrfK